MRSLSRRLSKVTNAACDITDFSALVAIARNERINFLVPGPDAPIIDGIVDYFAQHMPDVRCFGPSTRAAQMEGSKTFSKDFMKRHRIPTAAYESFDDHGRAKQYLETTQHNVVIKADGLAAGKGVIIPQSKKEALAALDTIMLDKAFGAAGDKVVIEEFLDGDEISILSFSDGTTIKSLPPAQDHKRIGNGDTGPNTGGMGTYAPTPCVSAQQLQDIDSSILLPTIDGMRKEGMPFVGCLFTGLIMTRDGPKVLEYNVRFGDPETQSLLPLMSSDLAMTMEACTEERLNDCALQVSPDCAATVVVAAKGYPGKYAQGTRMTLGPTPKDVLLFHAGTKLDGKDYKTAGGRVIASTATAPTLREAVDKAYKGVQCIEFEGMQYRTDIAARAFR